eukprot:6967880-Alexandrium_andersonii.AAC.1
MSASLVGSEMCIRDRSTAERRSGSWRAPPQDPVKCLVNSIVDQVGAAPVSYTHLTLPTICSV